jgi:MscS family membrane protein
MLEFTLVNFIDLLFYLCLIFYSALLITQFIEFIFLVFIDKAKVNGDKIKQQVYPLLKDIFKVLIWTIAIFTVLNTVFKVDIRALVAGLGIGGIAVAFALKDSLENLLASILIMIDRPFIIGDWVRVNGVEGTVEKVGFRNTLIRSFDKNTISVPNKKLLDNNLENFSERGSRRVKFELGAVYGLSEANMRQVADMLKEKIDNHPEVTGKPTILLDNFGDSSVNFIITYFVSVAEGVNFGEVKEDINYIVYDIMYRYAKGFPYPTSTQITGEEINDVV